MKTRSDKYFIGGENIDYKTRGNELFSEQLILIFVSLLCVVFFLIYPNFLQKSLAHGKLKFVFGLVLFLILSPFGAHLITFILSDIWKKVNLRLSRAKARRLSKVDTEPPSSLP